MHVREELNWRIEMPKATIKTGYDKDGNVKYVVRADFILKNSACRTNYVFNNMDEVNEYLKMRGISNVKYI